MNDPTVTISSQPSNERLERVWVRLQRVYERQGRVLDRANWITESFFQNLIDRMNESGKDTFALHAALDAFENALKEAHPVYESARGILNLHRDSTLMARSRTTRKP